MNQIRLETINSLSEDELALLYGILAILNTAKIELTPRLIACYKYKYLAKFVTEAREKIKEEYFEVYESLCNKLLIPCHPLIVDNTTKNKQDQESKETVAVN